ncbi:hypothetical protein M5X11_15565, partial [Paenibacillus alginolyticus]
GLSQFRFKHNERKYEMINFYDYAVIMQSTISLFLIIAFLYLVKTSQKLAETIQKKPKQGVSDEGIRIGSPFPQLNFDGKKFEANYVKSSGILIFITQVGCSLCNNLYPLINNYNNKNKTNFQFVLFTLASETEMVNAIIEQHQLHDIPSFSFTNKDKDIIDALKINGVPFIYFLSPNGKVVAKNFVSNEMELNNLVFSNYTPTNAAS